MRSPPETPTTPRKRSLAIIGTGASCLYILKNLLERIDTLGPTLESINLYERGARAGMGMPYNPATTDRYNLCNISSEEIPRLQLPLADWLRERSDSVLAKYDLRRDQISATETYARLALGEYFEAQFHDVIRKLRDRHIRVTLHLNTPVIDLRDEAEGECVALVTDKNEVAYDRVVIATGHSFDVADAPDHGFYASPWPIQKLLPAEGAFHNTTVGTLGASLSAFDVVSSLAHRHGRFEGSGSHKRFTGHAGAEQFRIVMHSAEGWLPHLQYEQCKPFREVYRYIGREALLALRDGEGFLRLGTYFDRVCRPVLAESFEKDRRPDVVAKLRELSYSLEDFVRDMSTEHEYADAFAGMKKEYPEARQSIKNDRPIHWKEALDDLMYTLSYHADLMPAEDHVRFRKTVMAFLMNVIAAMPLSSAQIMLALHEAGRLDLVTGRAQIDTSQPGKTVVNVEAEKGTKASTHDYKLFVDCTGQSGIKLDDFPFRSLVAQGAVRAASALFAKAGSAKETLKASPDRKLNLPGGLGYRLEGIDVDAAYRIVGNDGRSNPRLFDIAFPHTSGLRPYCYGLQACNHTAGVMVEAWVLEAKAGYTPPASTETLTRLHDHVANEA